MKRNKKVTYTLFTISFLGISILSGFLVASSIFKPTIEYSATYPNYTLDELSKVADNIVYGKVEARGETVSEKIYLPKTNNELISNSSEQSSYNLDFTKQEEVTYVEDLYTDISVKIITPIKMDGKIAGAGYRMTMEEQTILYKEEGGETENLRIVPDGGELNEGDEVILFTNHVGKSWGPQSVLKVIDGAVYDKNGTKYNVEELISRLNDDI
ncbi:hypothetical protein [Paenibacillus sp. FSL H8-0283]|uniref:hypothetical protein n=1 Tax=Paenibacillus sp. FSL H8-0283 TaxID=2921383 RepID=UPI00324DF41F